MCHYLIVVRMNEPVCRLHVSLPHSGENEWVNLRADSMCHYLIVVRMNEPVCRLHVSLPHSGENEWMNLRADSMCHYLIVVRMNEPVCRLHVSLPHSGENEWSCVQTPCVVTSQWWEWMNEPACRLHVSLPHSGENEWTCVQTPCVITSQWWEWMNLCADSMCHYLTVVRMNEPVCRLHVSLPHSGENEWSCVQTPCVITSQWWEWMNLRADSMCHYLTVVRMNEPVCRLHVSLPHSGENEWTCVQTPCVITSLWWEWMNLCAGSLYC